MLVALVVLGVLAAVAVAATINGSNGNDLLAGSGAADKINGFGGDDQIFSNRGRDSDSGGSGDDHVEGGSQGDRIVGDSGDDTLIGDGHDVVCPPGATSPFYCTSIAASSPGGDSLSGGSGNDRIEGNAGNDRIGGGSGNDRIEGNAGNDRIGARDRQSDMIDCGLGRDTVFADTFDSVTNCERVVRAVARAPTPATVWAVGDGDAEANGRAVAERIAAGPGDRLLYLGDVYPKVDDNKKSEKKKFSENYATSYGRLAKITRPTPGNHDWHPRKNNGYDKYWKHELGHVVPAWYAFHIGGWTLISLNSEAKPELKLNSPQERWLRAQLRRPGTCRIAFWHRPRYSAGNDHGDQADMAQIWNDLRGHAAIVLAGHSHNMERFKPIDGITEFVAGAGGKSRAPLNPLDPRLAFADDDDDGTLRLELRPGSASHAFISAAGRVLDSGSVSCDAGTALRNAG